MIKKEILEQLEKIKKDGFSAMISVVMPGYSYTEDTIVSNADIGIKMTYINAHFNSEGVHENNDDIRIVKVGEIGI